MLRLCLCFVLMLPQMVLAADRPTGTVRVVDADTWDVGGVRIRLSGIDAPELDQTCRDAQGVEWRCGAWATQVARQRFDGRPAFCEPVDRDRYGSVVARCYVAGSDAALTLVEDGLAFAYRKYSREYVPIEQRAAKEKKGLHATVIPVPWVHRAGTAGLPRQETCQIKGNISPSGEKIYHVSGQAFYTATKINKAKGERWFCDARAARLASWRPAKR